MQHLDQPPGELRDARPAFRPGVRFSRLDAIVLVLGGVGAGLAAGTSPAFALLIGAVVAHFFLFCNVFRVARPLELAWSAVFLGCAAARWLAGTSWWWPVAVVATTTVAVILRQIRSPSYHGIRWARWNPGLREWWARRTDAQAE